MQVLVSNIHVAGVIVTRERASTLDIGRVCGTSSTAIASEASVDVMAFKFD